MNATNLVIGAGMLIALVAAAPSAAADDQEDYGLLTCAIDSTDNGVDGRCGAAEEKTVVDEAQGCLFKNVEPLAGQPEECL